MYNDFKFVNKQILGKNLRLLRKASNITMKELGSLVGVSEQAISQYERGLREPGIEILNKISHVLDIPYDFLTSKIIKKVIKFETLDKLNSYNPQTDTSSTDEYYKPINLSKYKKELNHSLLSTIDNMNIDIDESKVDDLINSTINNFFTSVFRLRKKTSSVQSSSNKEIHYIIEHKLLYIIAES
ncbi:MAG: helix-turn-helix domain-containing protein [Clostridium sp.]|uniref:helix-turn-helix domain-containing protein n=1 Tax=Clostridium TaxID=1485 RepID=UPI002903D768|nr:helix-turn-helix domain-containing protein [Clostridium sp.]MDU1280018.1 helix-turn-helix domain-containing protein [Clostridium sp.]MDU7089083.1 helix-turn-helix domain-containing protein [Clostridium sp.]